MKRFVWVAAVFLSSCRTVEVEVPVASVGSISQVPLEADGKPIDLRVLFAEDLGLSQDNISLIFEKDRRPERSQSEGSFPYLIGTPLSASYFVARAGFIPAMNAQNAILEVIITRNTRKLPPYEMSEETFYEPARAMKSVGQWVRRERAGNGRYNRWSCNGVLVGDDLVLTNYHCMANATECETSTFILSTAEQAQSSGCKEVLFADPLFDQTLIRLKSKPSEHFERAPIEPEDYYFPLQTTLALVSTFGDWDYRNQSWRATEGAAQVKSEYCTIEALRSFVRVNQISAGGEEADSGRSGAHLTSYTLSCPVVLGQSGSPIFGLDGRLLGLLWGRLEMSDGDVDALFTPLLPQIKNLIHSLSD